MKLRSSLRRCHETHVESMTGKKRRNSAAANEPNKKLKLSSNDHARTSLESNEREQTRDGGGGGGGGGGRGMEEEEDFPRGGQGVLTALEKRTIREEAMKDTLFNERGEDEKDEETAGPRAKSKKRRSKGSVTGVGSKKSLKRVETLSPKRMVPGVLVLGAVQEVGDLEVSVSLPCSMYGTISVGNVSEPITEGVEEEMEEEQEKEEDAGVGKKASSLLHRLFCPGQLVVCCVLEGGGGGGGGGGGRNGEKSRKRGIELTVNPRVVNSHMTSRNFIEGMVVSGWVKSVEDHGYIIDFGVSNKTGFLLKKNTTEFLKTSGARCLVRGQVVRVKILSDVDARSVPVTVEPSVVGGALVGGDSLVQLHALQPGILVNTSVKEVASNGIVVSFLGGFEGTVSLHHLPSSETPPTSFTTNKKVKGRLLWVDVEAKKVGVSLQRTLVEGRSFTFQGVEFGDIYEDVEVIKIYPDSSLLLRLSSETIGFCPLPLVNDENQETSSLPRLGSHHTCRVIQFNLIDGVAIVSLQSSVISQRYVRYNDISVGDILEATVERLGNFGAILGIQGNIRGLCPASHLTEAPLRNPQRKFPEGKSVKCRVLHVESEEKRVLLTCKKSLLRLREEEVLAEYSQAEAGRMFRGVVNRINDRGFSVFFFNNIVGYVHRSEMVGTEGGGGGSFPDPATVVRPGQVVECRVLGYDLERKRLRLSQRLDSHAVSPENQLQPGMRIRGEVTGVAAEGITLCCRETGEYGFLPLQHLSDYLSHCGGLLSQHQLGLETAVKQRVSYEMEDVLVVSGRGSTRLALLSLKQSLLRSAAKGGWVQDYSQLKPEQLLTGFIKKTMSYGCFVEFPHNLSALAPTKYLQDEFTVDPTLVYSEGQTVFAKVLEVDTEKKRFLVSLRPSDVCSCDWSWSNMEEDKEEEEKEEVKRKTLGERLERFLIERETVFVTDTSLSPGSVVMGTVMCVEDGEIVIELERGQLGKATILTAPVKEVGEEVVGCVLEVRGEEVRISLNPTLVESCRARGGGGGDGRKKKKSKDTAMVAQLQTGESVVGIVEWTTPHYLLLSISTLSGTTLVYAATDSGQLEVYKASYTNIKIGQKVSAVVHSPASELCGKRCGLPVVVVTGTMVAKETSKKSSKPSYMNVKIGDIIDVIVKGVKTNFLSVMYHLWHGRIHCCLATDTPSIGHTPFDGVSPGDVVRARVVGMRKKEIKRVGSKKGAGISTLELTTRKSLLDPTVELDSDDLLKKTPFSEGDEMVGFVNEVNEKGIFVYLSPKVKGHVPLMLAHTDHMVLRNMKRNFAEGEAVRCTVVGARRKNLPILSLIGDISTTVGSVIECMVKETTPLCLVVMAPWWAGFAHIDITDLSDNYDEDPLVQFRERRGESVRCAVVKVEEDRMDLSLRHSRVSGMSPVGNSPDREMTSLEDLPEGAIVRGYVKAVTSVGVFIRLGRGLDGRVQIKNLADGFVKNFKERFREGQLVTVKVLSVDVAKRQIELSLRLSHIDPAAAKKERRRADRERAKKEKEEEEEEEEESEVDSDSGDSEFNEDEEEKEGEENDEVTDEDDDARPTLQLSGYAGFVWEKEKREEGGNKEEEEEDTEAVSSKKTRRQKKAALKAEEEQLYQAERAQLDGSRPPENVEDFERLLLSQPNSSALWVQYMAFLLQTAEVDKARAVGEKALQTISFREEKEKLNVWVARLNLENLYGSQDSLMAVFTSALQQNDPLEVSRRLATIYRDSDKMNLAEQLYQTMTRQFRSELSVWTEFGLFLMKRGKMEAARRLLQRCLKTLTLKQHHVEAISKFAQWEFKYGDVGRGCTMFESLLSSYPRRTDLWSVYIDMLVKTKQLQQARDTLERAIHLKLSAKKMKLMFKRYLEFERQHGSPAGVEAVKEKARTYVDLQQNNGD